MNSVQGKKVKESEMTYNNPYSYSKNASRYQDIANFWTPLISRSAMSGNEAMYSYTMATGLAQLLAEYDGNSGCGYDSSQYTTSSGNKGSSADSDLRAQLAALREENEKLKGQLDEKNKPAAETKPADNTSASTASAGTQSSQDTSATTGIATGSDEADKTSGADGSDKSSGADKTSGADGSGKASGADKTSGADGAGKASGADKTSGTDGADKTNGADKSGGAGNTSGTGRKRSAKEIYLESQDTYNKGSKSTAEQKQVAANLLAWANEALADPESSSLADLQDLSRRLGICSDKSKNQRLSDKERADAADAKKKIDELIKKRGGKVPSGSTTTTTTSTTVKTASETPPADNKTTKNTESDKIKSDLESLYKQIMDFTGNDQYRYRAREGVLARIKEMEAKLTPSELEEFHNSCQSYKDYQSFMSYNTVTSYDNGTQKGTAAASERENRIKNPARGSKLAELYAKRDTLQSMRPDLRASARIGNLADIEEQIRLITSGKVEQELKAKIAQLEEKTKDYGDVGFFSFGKKNDLAELERLRKELASLY